MNPGTLTLGDQLRETASAVGDKTAVIGAERTLTWAELRDEVGRVAALLADMGISRGDAVGLCTSKRPEVVVAFLALAQLGAIAAPVNHKLEASRIYDQFVTQNLVGVILEHHLESVILPVAKRVEDRVLYVSERGGLPGDCGVSPTRSQRSRPMPESRTWPATTTAHLERRAGPRGGLESCEHPLECLFWVEGLHFGADEVFLCMFSVFSHPHELFHRALLTGAACVVVETLSPRVVAELVATHRVTWMMAVPSFYEMMLDHVGPEHHDVSSLRVLEAGGAWVSPDTSARLEDRYGCGFMPVWGSTRPTESPSLFLRTRSEFSGRPGGSSRRTRRRFATPRGGRSRTRSKASCGSAAHPSRRATSACRMRRLTPFAMAGTAPETWCGAHRTDTSGSSVGGRTC